MSEYTYTDTDGYGLRFRRSDVSGCAQVVSLAGTVDIPVADLPKVVAELYKAAGQDPPVVHEHVDDEGVGLSIVSSEYRPNVAFVEGCNGAYVTPEDLPGLVRKLYEAAGQEPPILLPRPTISDLGGWIDGQRVNVDAIRTAGLVTPGRARGLAARLAASADVAEAEPDPEAINQLAEVICAGDRTTRGFAQLIARAVLAAGYARGEA